MFDTGIFQEYAKLFNPNNNSGIDVARFSSIQQQTIESATEAGKTWFDGVQKIMRAYSEFAQEQAQAAANVASKILSNKSPEENLDIQTRYAQGVFDQGVAKSQELAKVASNTSVKVFDIINKQAVNNLSEFASTAANSNAGKRKASNS